MAEETAEHRAARLELEEETAKIGRALKGALRDEGMPHVGFVLLMFDFGADGAFAFCSNAQRDDVVRFLKEAREKIGDRTQ